MENQNLKTKQHLRNLFISVVFWFLSLALATLGAKFIWQNEIVIEIIMLIINILLGVGVITMFLRALNNSDELQQKIQLEALALAFGVGIIGGAAYSLLDATALISKGDVQISFLLLLMIFTYMVGVIIGTKRFN